MNEFLSIPGGNTIVVNAIIDLSSEEDRTIKIVRKIRGKEHVTIDIIPEFEILDCYRA